MNIYTLDVHEQAVKKYSAFLQQMEENLNFLMITTFCNIMFILYARSLVKIHTSYFSKITSFTK